MKSMKKRYAVFSVVGDKGDPNNPYGNLALKHIIVWNFDENRADHWVTPPRETLDDLIGGWSVEDRLARTTPNKVLAACMSKEWINTYGIFGKTLIKELEV